ncbi:MAG: amidohydrolase family protein [Nitriliruptorales bacterium]
MARTVFHGGAVFDGTGTPPSRADVVVEDGRFVTVGADLDGDEGVDVSGKTLLPGLFDCHTHVAFTKFDYMAIAQRPFSLQFYEAARNLEATLLTGITSIRDAWGIDLGVKRALELGYINGPRAQISIVMLSQTGGHADNWMLCGGVFEFIVSHPGLPSWIVDGPVEARKKVREVVRAGADVIKIAASGGVLSPADDPRHAHLRDDELVAIVEEATFSDIPVMAHCHSAQGAKNAIRAGVRSIEHGTYLDDEAMEMMIETGTFLVPTLVAAQGVIDAAEAGASIPEVAVEKAREVVPVHRDAVRRAVEAGVRIAMGTDSAVTPHGENLRELVLMEKSGMSPADVLVATTRTAAELLEVEDELGTIEEGKRADLVVVDGDALELDGLRDRIEQVWMDGDRVV